MRLYAFHRAPLTLPAGHPFPASKYALLRESVVQACPEMPLLDAPEATEGELALVHEPSYIDRVQRGLLSGAEQREIGFPWSVQMAQRARLSVGATTAAARAALTDGVAAQLAGGTHHAQAGKGSGYCVFNDVAVAARLMQVERHRMLRQGLQVLVLDLDVHQGNGTAAIFQDDPSVFTLSLHGARNFPFRKQASDLDVELPDGCDDATYLAALDDALAQAWRRLPRPADLVFFLAGADPHEADRLGRLRLTSDGLRQRDEQVFEALLERRIPVAVVMAGGYGRDVGVTVAIHLQTLRLAQHYAARWQREVLVGETSPGRCS